MTFDLEKAVVHTKDEQISPRPNNSLSLTNRVVRKEEKSLDTDGLEDAGIECMKCAAKVMLHPLGFIIAASNSERPNISEKIGAVVIDTAKIVVYGGIAFYALSSAYNLAKQYL